MKKKRAPHHQTNRAPIKKPARRKRRAAPAAADPVAAAAQEKAAADAGKAEEFDRLMAAAVMSPSEELVRRVLQPSKARTRTGGWKAVFLETLGATANVTLACQAAGVTRGTAYENQKSDKAFAAAWAEQLAQAVDLMEEEARRRAFDGVLSPKFQGGGLAGLVREYSDTLAIFLLKAHRPDKYRERVSVKNESPVRPIDVAAAAALVSRFLGEVEPGAPAGGSEAGGEAAGAGG